MHYFSMNTVEKYSAQADVFCRNLYQPSIDKISKTGDGCECPASSGRSVGWVKGTARQATEVDFLLHGRKGCDVGGTVS